MNYLTRFLLFASFVCLCEVACNSPSDVNGVTPGSDALPRAVPGRLEEAWAADGADPGQLGRFAVGHASYIPIDTNNANRPVYVGVFYPVDARTITHSSEPAQYPLAPLDTYLGLPNSTSLDWQAYGMPAAYEAVTPSNEGPFPLVMISPAAGTNHFFYIDLAARLASHGYVATVLEHYSDCQWFLCDRVINTMVNRPRDVSFAITQLLARDSQKGQLLYRLIDQTRIGMVGHSIGGYTTFALAGGVDEVCEALVLALAGDDSLPYPASTCVPTVPDRRIKTIVTLDGSSWAMRFEELARIKIPTLIMGETVDASANPAFGLPGLLDWIARPHAAIGLFDSYRVDVNGANHYSFTNLCDAVLPVLGNYWDSLFGPGLVAGIDGLFCERNGVFPMGISPQEAHLAVARYAVAFLNIYLKQEFLDFPDWYVLTPEYALTHTPTVGFINGERCDATLPDNTYFTYRHSQASNECDIAQKDPTGWFTSESDSETANAASMVTPATAARRKLGAR